MPKAEVSISTEILEEIPRFRLPTINQLLPSIKETVSKMEAEAPEWVAYQSATFDLLSIFHDSAPPNAVIGSNVCCAGASVRCSSGNISYYTIRVVGPDPTRNPAPVYKSEAGVVSKQGVLDKPGRMNGVFGWSADRNLIAGALASYTHNFVAMLIAYFERPSLPLTQAWKLPNLVLEETKAPKQFHPAASFTFRHPPTPLAFYRIRVSSETPAKIGLEWWDANKNDLARVDEVDVDAGVTDVLAYVTLPFAVTQGYFSINVIDAPKGIVIERVETIPPCY
jgi:hypothetical protein